MSQINCCAQLILIHFEKKIEKINFENIKNITCSILKLLKTFIIINIKIRQF